MSFEVVSFLLLVWMFFFGLSVYLLYYGYGMLECFMHARMFGKERELRSDSLGISH